MDKLNTGILASEIEIPIPRNAKVVKIANNRNIIWSLFTIFPSLCNCTMKNTKNKTVLLYE